MKNLKGKEVKSHHMEILMLKEAVNKIKRDYAVCAHNCVSDSFLPI